MVPAEDKRGEVRIEHVYTGGSTVQALPYLVEAQRRSDRHEGRGTWVLVGTDTEEALLVNELRNILASRAREQGNDDDDGVRWGVRCTQDIEHSSPGDDCVFITTNENVLLDLMVADGATPKQFSGKVTFMLDMGWGNLTTKAAYAYDRLVKFAFDNRETTNHFFCTISSDEFGPFNTGWVTRQQHCRVIMEGEVSQPIAFWDDITQPLLAMEKAIISFQRDRKSRAIILMEYSDALEMEMIGGDPDNLEKHCHVLSRVDGPEKTRQKLSDTSKHIMTNGKELTYLGDIPGVTHILLFPIREGCMWDKNTNQVVFDADGLQCPTAQLRHAISWGGSAKAPQIHYLAPRLLYNNLEEEPMDSSVYTSDFDNHVLSCISAWPQFPVAGMPLRVGRNPDLIEHRLRRLTYKGILEIDRARDPEHQGWEPPRYRGFLKLTPVGRVVSELVNPYITAMDSADAACLVGQLVVRTHRVSAVVKDAVCSLAVVLTSKHGVTLIDSVIRPYESYKQYIDCPKSLAFEHCHRGPIWLAACVWHFTLTNQMWKTATHPLIRQTVISGEFTEANSSTMALWYRNTFEWERVGNQVKRMFDGFGMGLEYAGVNSKLSPEELLEVEFMLVTAFLDNLAFVFVPDRDRAFGCSMTTGAELPKPTDEQMRLINLDKCWQEDKAAVGRETLGVFCIFTHSRTYDDEGGRVVARPYDLTHVSTAAVERALRVNAPVMAGDIFRRIAISYSLEQ